MGCSRIGRIGDLTKVIIDCTNGLALVYHLYLGNATAGLTFVIASTFSRNFEPVVEDTYLIGWRYIGLSSGYFLYISTGVVAGGVPKPLVAKGGSVDGYTKLISPFSKLIGFIQWILWIRYDTSGWFVILDNDIGSLGFTTLGILSYNGIATRV